MPFICQIAVGQREELKFFGSDYETQDGSSVRDFIHVYDLTKDYPSALEKCFNSSYYLYGYCFSKISKINSALSRKYF